MFFRAGKLAFLDELTGSEYKELAPDIAKKVRSWLLKKRWRRHTIAVVATLRLTRFLQSLRLLRHTASTPAHSPLFLEKPQATCRIMTGARGRHYTCRRRLFAASFFMLLMANRPKLSLKRAREIRQRNAACLLQKYGRMMLACLQMNKELRAIGTMQRLLRGYCVRAQNGGALTPFELLWGWQFDIRLLCKQDGSRRSEFGARRRRRHVGRRVP